MPQVSELCLLQVLLTDWLLFSGACLLPGLPAQGAVKVQVSPWPASIQPFPQDHDSGACRLDMSCALPLLLV